MQPKESIWTNPRAIAVFNEAVAKGYTSSQIALKLSDELGQTVTRNAVISKAHRTGKQIGRRKTHVPVSESRYSKPVDVDDLYDANVNLLEDIAADMRKVADDPIPARVEKPAPASGVTFAELQPHHCRWPIGDPLSSDFRYCGCKKVKGSYCDKHYSKAYMPITKAKIQNPTRRVA